MAAVRFVPADPGGFRLYIRYSPTPASSLRRAPPPPGAFSMRFPPRQRRQKRLSASRPSFAVLPHKFLRQNQLLSLFSYHGNFFGFPSSDCFRLPVSVSRLPCRLLSAAFPFPPGPLTAPYRAFRTLTLTRSSPTPAGASRPSFSPSALSSFTQVSEIYFTVSPRKFQPTELCILSLKHSILIPQTAEAPRTSPKSAFPTLRAIKARSPQPSEQPFPEKYGNALSEARREQARRETGMAGTRTKQEWRKQGQG